MSLLPDQFILPQKWQVRFMVKQRKQDSGKTYYYQDFIGSFCDVGGLSDNMTTILDNMALVPCFESRLRGIVTIFREGVLPAYEDKANSGGKLVRFSFYQSPEEAQKVAADYEADERKPPEKLRKIAPALPKCNSLVYFFITYALAGGFKSENGPFNGLYIKTEFGLICVDFWFGSHLAADEAFKKLQDMFQRTLDDKLFIELKNERKVISQTLQTIEMAAVPQKRGPSQYNKDKSVPKDMRSVDGGREVSFQKRGDDEKKDYKRDDRGGYGGDKGYGDKKKYQNDRQGDRRDRNGSGKKDDDE